MTRILFYLDEPGYEIWKEAFIDAIPGVDVRNYPHWGEPEDGPAYAFVWNPKPGIIADQPNITHVFSFGAGVDHILRDPTIPEELPVIRMSDDGLKDGMAEFVLMSVLMHHRGMHKLMAAQLQKQWIDTFYPTEAADVRVGMLGYGALARAAISRLLPIGYKINAWSRTPKATENNVTHYAGREDLADFLNATDILVCLLPATSETNNLLDADTLSLLPKGAAIINAGRGNLIDIDALVVQLDSDHLSGATLDVFPTEPLPQGSLLWHHPKITITPHIAAITRPKNATRYVAHCIAQIERGKQPDNLLDRSSGY
ncbi:2-hydroxyacid dehydrogenase [Kordiimonas aquimaris]|uniref:2-hydroxyacid dehydrogenase n=1 Tax=Kordiimonas aquimaris TaxID=707591 RepID=UPI0021D2F6F5|nr:glyoxylate/hydroxypyruvate reductase A [Kordiimonas aquimaris]